MEIKKVIDSFYQRNRKVKPDFWGMNPTCYLCYTIPPSVNHSSNPFGIIDKFYGYKFY